MQSKIIFLLMLTSFRIDAAEVCKSGEIRYMHNKKYVSNVQSFCHEGNQIYSLSCKGKNCDFLQAPEKRPVDISSTNPTVGSPGFKVCRALGGQPQIFEYRFSDQKDWTEDSRCIFGKDEFVSNDMILGLWKDYTIR